jgi:CheY-like chemotaxis protein
MAAPEDLSAAGPRVLVVDDYQDGADSLTLMLRTLGADARAVYDGETALASAVAFQPALVLLDLSLPGVSGLAVARALKGLAALRATRFVALSGWSDEGTRHETEVAGFDAYLVKPVELETIRDLLAALPARPSAGC